MFRQSLFVTAALAVAATDTTRKEEERFAALKATEGTTEVWEAGRVRHELEGLRLSFGSVGRGPVKEFVKRRCEETGFAVLIEVGVWLGQSVAEWLSSSSCVRVVGVDPFLYPKPDNPAFNKALALSHIRRSVNNTSRVHLVTGYAPEALRTLRIDADVVYLDGGKTKDAARHERYLRESLRAYASLFPGALIAGDDWKRGTTPRLQPVLREWASSHFLTLAVSGGRTWLMMAEESSSRRRRRLLSSENNDDERPWDWVCAGDNDGKDEIVWVVRSRALFSLPCGRDDDAVAFYD